MIKKKYITPELETIYLYMEPVMTNDSVFGGFGDGDDEEIMDPDDQGAGGHRGDWENIWGNM